MDQRFGFKNGKSGAAITVRVSTRSSTAGISGIMEDGTIKIRLTSAPVDGRANEELIKLMVHIFGIPKTNFEIIAGISNKTKLVAIYGIDSDMVNQIIQEIVQNSD